MRLSAKFKKPTIIVRLNNENILEGAQNKLEPNENIKDVEIHKYHRVYYYDRRQTRKHKIKQKILNKMNFL